MEPKLQYYINIKDANGKPLAGTITSLRYKFSEDEDDLCEIELESDDRYIADSPSYKEGSQLSCVWGWINGLKSNTRKVYIFDRDTQYKQDGKVQLKLVCHEKFVVAKMDAVANKNLTQLKDNSPIVLSSNVIKNVKLEIQKGNKELKALIDNNNFNLGLTASPYGNNYKIVSTYNGNMSTYYTLRQILDRLPGGPYIMDSRDDLLLIRTRDFSQGSRKTFTWKGGSGELKDFKPITKNRSTKSGADTTQVNTYDPETKTSTNVTAKSGPTKDVKLANGKTIDIYLDGDAFRNIKGNGTGKFYPDGTPKAKSLQFTPRATDKMFTPADITGALQRDKINQIEKKKNGVLGVKGVNKDLLQAIRKSNDEKLKTKDIYKDFSKKEVDRGLVVKTGVSTGNSNITLNQMFMGYDNGKNFQGGNSRDNTAVARNNFALIPDQTSIRKAIMSNDPKEKAAAHAENLQKNAELEMNPATADLIGQPEIEVGQIITILGVAKIHEGNYYISECEHILKEDVYDLSLSKLLRHGINDLNTGTSTKYKYKKKKGKVDLYSLIPNNPNLPPKTPVQIINGSKGPEDNPTNRKKVTIKTPDKS